MIDIYIYIINLHIYFFGHTYKFLVLNEALTWFSITRLYSTILVGSLVLSMIEGV